MDLAALHGTVISFAIIGAWLSLSFWGLALSFTSYEETPTYWRAVSVAQVLQALQLVVGLLLLVTVGRLPGGKTLDQVFHPLYGIVFPVMVLLVAHRQARAGTANAHRVFALASFLMFALALRGWTAIAWP